MAFVNQTLNSTSPPSDGFLSIWNSRYMDYYRYAVFITVLVVSLVGNMAVIIAIMTSNLLKTVTNYFLLNMAAADVLVTVVCMPTHLLLWDNPSLLSSNVTCKIMPFIEGASICSVINTLVIIAFDRYVVIIKPLRRRINKKQCYIVIAFIWLVSIFTVSPSLFVYAVEYDTRFEVYRCDEYGWSERSRMVYTGVLFTLYYVLPLCLMTFMYARILIVLWFRKIPGFENLPNTLKQRAKKKFLDRRKVIRMLLVVVVTFMLCQLPQNVLNILWYLQDSIDWKPPKYMVIIGFHSEFFLYLCNALNPIIYGFLHGKIKYVIRQFLCYDKLKHEYSRASFNDTRRSRTRFNDQSFKTFTRGDSYLSVSRYNSVRV